MQMKNLMNFHETLAKDLRDIYRDDKGHEEKERTDFLNKLMGQIKDAGEKQARKMGAVPKGINVAQGEAVQLQIETTGARCNSRQTG